ncbi:peptide/nickel transport system substrate-binding protein [Alkalispirochaeta americana]|uniref:Peptide/nickel transport system substrate-binding protein n=1 Tax=Alkalispirochaeta americana TaxID=159291 RepID=A0A1N6TKC9_9SPIO|nr:ABC transporter substrate-binding protein [Alkalispirochaeta americana]SIQ53795.1 peptide/nickel transport system substrate-binding protein [Alkalispirochaeta americana]
MAVWKRVAARKVIGGSLLLRVFLVGVMAAMATAAFGAGAPEAVPGRDVLAIAVRAEPESLDPVKASSSSAISVVEHLVEGLVVLEEGLPGTAPSLVPGLAERWESNRDSTVWTFHIRRGVTFHDGTPLDARAVQANLERSRDARTGAAGATLLEDLESIEVVGSHTVRIRLARPCAPFPAHLAHPSLGIVSPSQFRQLAPGESLSLPAGTGPYVVDHWARGEQITLAINPRYRGPSPLISRLVFTFLPQASARIAALENGDIDVALEIPPGAAETLETLSGITVVRQSTVRTIYIGLNTRRGPLDRPLVRQALNHAIHRDRILELLQGEAIVADGPLAPAVFGYAPVASYDYDPSRARQLLARAGFPEGFDMVLYHPRGRYPRDVAVAEAVQDMLLDVGVRLRLESHPWPRLLDLTALPADQAGYDAYLMGQDVITLDGDWGLFRQFHSEQAPPGGDNRGFYSNPVVDDLLSRGRAEVDPLARREIYAEVIQEIRDDAPWIVLYHQGQIKAVRSEIRGLSLHPLGYLRTGQARFIDSGID